MDLVIKWLSSILSIIKSINCKLTELVYNSSNSNQIEVTNLGDIPLGIEASFSHLGCIKDSNGVVTGKVMSIATKDEETGVESFEKILFNLDGTTSNPYIGGFDICDEGNIIKERAVCIQYGSQVIRAYQKIELTGTEENVLSTYDVAGNQYDNPTILPTCGCDSVYIPDVYPLP